MPTDIVKTTRVFETVISVLLTICLGLGGWSVGKIVEHERLLAGIQAERAANKASFQDRLQKVETREDSTERRLDEIWRTGVANNIILSQLAAKAGIAVPKVDDK